MKVAEFEEKEFEAPLYNQLEAGNQHVWSPGQVFEHQIGIDRALFMDDPAFWGFVRHARRRGVLLNSYRFDFIWPSRSRRPLPNFRLNLFIQAKRPNYYRKPPKRIRDAGIATRCWAFSTDQQQQLVLEKVAKRLSSRALVVYASPAFHRLSQLYGYTSSGTVVENSTFPEIALMSGHAKWFYNQAGAGGIANPDPEFIRAPALADLIERFRAQSERVADVSPLRELAALSGEITAALGEAEVQDNPRVAYFFSLKQNISAELSPLAGVPRYIYDFLYVSAFAEAFNVEWYVVSEA